jgi:hypothetical protein
MVALEEINFQQTNLGGSLPGELFELPSLSKAYLHQSNLPSFSVADADTYLRPWRDWTPVAERAPHVEPALWAAAGFTVDDALAMIDAGGEPDTEVLLGLAALRRTG